MNSPPSSGTAIIVAANAAAPSPIVRPGRATDARSTGWYTAFSHLTIGVTRSGA